MEAQAWRILHIDDDEDDRFLVKMMLGEARGQAVTLESAGTYEEGRAKLASSRFDAVLVDYDMGASTGIKLIREFAGRGYGAPMILLTGRGSYEVDVEAMHAGATLYLTKSEINPLLLERSIRYAIERKQAEAALRERDRRLTVALDAAQLGAWILNYADDTMEMDERAQQMYCASQPVESHERLVQSFFHPEDIPALRAAHAIAARPDGDGKYQAEYRIRQPDGATHWITAWGLVEFEGQGNERRAVRLAGASRDITSEKRAEESLRESEARFRDLANNISQLAWMADETGSIFWYNQRWFDYTGASMSEVEGWGWKSLHHPKYAQAVVEKFRRAVASGEVWEDTFPIRGRDGQYHWFLSRAVPIKDDQGRVTRWFGTNTDITEQQNLQMENRQQRDLLERLLQSAPVGIAFLKGPQHIYTLTNEEYRRYARGKGELIGYSVAEKWPEIASTVLPQMDRVFETGEPFSILNAPLTIVRNGVPENDYFSYTFTPINKADGSIEGVMILAVDNTTAVRYQQEVEEHSARLQAVLQSLPVGVWIADQSGQMVGKNEQADQIWAGEASLTGGFSGYQQFKAWWPDTGERVQEDEWPMSRAVQKGEHTYGVEMEIERFDGTRGTVLVSASPVVDQNGSRTGGVAALLDITARKQVEDALLQSESNFRALSEALENSRAYLQAVLNNLAEGVLIVDREGAIVDMNPPALELLGFHSLDKSRIRPEDYVSRFEIFTLEGEPLEFAEWPITRVARGETYLNVAVRVRRIDSGQEWIGAFDGKPITGPDGKMQTGVFTMRDITAEKMMEQAIQEKEARFRQLADSMPQLVWTARPEGAVDYFNQRAGLYKGILASDASRWDWTAAVHPDDLSPTASAWREAVETKTDYQMEHRLCMADGSYRWHLSRAHPSVGEQGELLRWYGTSTDIHERKQAEANLADYAEKLSRSNEELENFALVASHDLQEPLRKIRMFGDSLRRFLEGPQAKEAADYLNRMVGAAERMQAMIDALLDLSRVSTRGKPFDAVDMDAVAREVVSDLEARIRSTGGEVRVSPLPMVMGDALQLHQLLQNLIGNGLKFHREDAAPSVSVTGETVEAGGKRLARIMVEDNGIGFDESGAEQVFHPFVRLHGRSEYEGSGMGLAICRKIVERHGGTITAESRPEEGSRFVITLPMP